MPEDLSAGVRPRTHPVGTWMVLALVVLSGARLRATDAWPQFRGPSGNGHSGATDLPLYWGETENVAWKSAVPGNGYSSPVVGEERIWLTTATDADLSLRAICFDRSTGELLHNVELFRLTKNEKTAVFDGNTNASCTPVLDAGRVYVHFGTFGTACLDSATGEILWKNEELTIDHEVGPGSSPIVWKHLLIVHFDGYDEQFVAAFDKLSGKVTWKTTRSGKQPRRGTEKKSHSTPVIIQDAGRTQLISAGSDWIYSYDPSTGTELWRAGYGSLGFEIIPRPIIGHGLVYTSTGFGTGQVLAIRHDGEGDVTKSHIVWRHTKGVPRVPSMLLVGEALYMTSDNGIGTCLEAKTGKVHWNDRIGGDYSASPIYADGRIYFLSSPGKTTVVKPGTEYEVLATNQLDGVFKASVAVAGRAMYFRSATHLYCVEKAGGETTETVADSRFQIPATDEGLPGSGPIRRYEWFKTLWQEKRSEWAENVARDQNALVFLGDSITQGWGPKLRNSFAGVKVANRGISGDTTRGMLLRLEGDVLSLNPKGVVLLMGTNDLEENARPETIAGNLKLVLAALKRHNPTMPIVLCRVMPSSASKKRPADKIQALNRLYAAAAKGDSQITLIDTWTLFANANGDARKTEFPDLLHPNALGYRVWAAALTPVLATLDFLENEPDDFTPEDGFISLFNGRDLTGWGFRPTPPRKKPRRPYPVFVEVKEAVTFDGRTTSSDGRYVAKNGRLIVTTPVEGRRIQQIWTTREFPSDFVLKLEFRATPNADSGIFIRKPQLQCRDYPLAGPYKTLQNYRPQDWNEVVITVKGGIAHCTCNGEVLEAEFKVPETGPIGLEGDRGQMEYRRIRIQEF